MRFSSKVLLAALFATACGRASDAASPPHDDPAPDVRHEEVAIPSEPVDLDALDGPERIALEQALAARDARYLPRLDETGPVLDGAAGVGAVFTAEGARLSVGAFESSLHVTALGRPDDMRSVVPTSRPEIVGLAVHTSLGGGTTEWWRSLPSGLEHGLTIAERPAGTGGLLIEVALSGELTPVAISEDQIALNAEGGRRVGSYAHLVVLDAGGERVAAVMRVEGRRIVLDIRDDGARYPLVVDPFVTAEEAVFRATSPVASDDFGATVSLSADGTRVLIGAPRSDPGTLVNAGSARVFVRTGASWTEEAVLEAADGVAGDLFATSVALSADGTRAVIGVPQDQVPPAAGVAGSARVFLRVGSVWAQEALLEAFDAAADDNFGQSVAISADGSRVVIGASFDDTASGANAGTARVFLRTGTSWAEEATLLGTNPSASDQFGRAVAISPDGLRVIVGAPEDDHIGGTNEGTATVFLRTGTTWTEEAFITPLMRAVVANFGDAVALSTDGSRALIGAPGSGSGAATVFLRTGTSWTEEMRLPTPVGSNNAAGRSVALSSDGSRALVGIDGFSAQRGTARLYLRVGTVWSEEAQFDDPLGAGGDRLGSSVSLSADGSRALVGAKGDDDVETDSGSSRLFTVALGPLGWACTSDALCASGFCTDGVCCGTRCAGGANDCQACSNTLTGVVSGTCAPLSASVAPSVTCRDAAMTPCDTPEVCVAGNATCPADTFAPSTTLCRGAAGDCDVDEMCTGSSAMCPVDTFVGAGTVCDPATPTTCQAQSTCTGAAAACPARPVAPMGTVCRTATGPCDAVETCGGMMASCPPDGRIASGTVCNAPTGPCDTAELCDGLSVACPANLFSAAGVPCRPATGVCDAPESCTGTSAACPADMLLGASIECRAAAGTCDVAESCNGVLRDCPTNVFAPVSALCGPAVAGVCDTPDHCSGTSAACVPTFLTTVCRAAAGACDLPESCTGADAACPTDALVSNGVVCGGATPGSCSSPGTCNGVAPGCPGASPLPAGTICQPAIAGNPCDINDVCDGSSDACQPRFLPAGTVCDAALLGPCDAPDVCAGTSADCVPTFQSGLACRPATGTCDVAESCNGAQAGCPADGFVVASSICRPVAGGCDVEEQCTGAGPDCPAEVLVASGTVCRALTSACDLTESCDGTSPACPVDAFAPVTAGCGPGVSGVCDAPDHCSGTSADCVDTYLSGVECRSASGACDAPEFCAGSATSCPPDALESSGMSCRASVDPGCDPVESCDGFAAACPSDVNTCGADADTRDAGGGDAMAEPDAGAPIPAAGCACRLAPARTTTPGSWLMLLTLVALARARRRRGGLIQRRTSPG
jgi:hypothetical protein